MKLTGSTRAGRTVGTIFLALGSAFGLGALIAAGISALFGLGQDATKITFSVVFLLILLLFVPDVRRAAKEH